jgi:hypothetical protein
MSELKEASASTRLPVLLHKLGAQSRVADSQPLASGPPANSLQALNPPL